jgi:cysteine synthase A
VDAFVAGAGELRLVVLKFVLGSHQIIGTGGTVAGVGRYLKSKNEEIIVAIADPEGSGLYNKVGARQCLRLRRPHNVPR